jgi:hypothetical protein
MSWKKNFVVIVITIVVLQIVTFSISKVVDFISIPEKEVTVNAPADMEDAFSAALKKTDLKNDYKVVITSDEKADISVGYNKEKDGTYTKFAYSPFVMAYNDDKDIFKSLKASKIVKKSKYSDDEYNFNMLKLINTVIEGKSLKDLGFPTEATIFVPAENSDYWTSFYDFMLITLNDGSYPQDDTEIEKLKSKIVQFLDSKTVEQVSDFDSQLISTNYFSEGAIYILPEQKAGNLSYKAYNDDKDQARIFYLNATVNLNFYVRANTKNGKKVLSKMNSSKFFEKLYLEFYRSEASKEIFNHDCVKDARDSYKVVDPYRVQRITVDIKQY